MAVVKVGDVGAKPLTLGDSDHVQVGDKVIAIGSPLALQNTVSDGVSKRNSERSDSNQYTD